MTSRTLGLLVLGLALSALALASEPRGSITGTVRDSAGVPQMGAAIQVLGGVSLTPVLTVFSDDHGRFSVKGLLPDTYRIKASAPAFIPALREDINLKTSTAVVVDITLNTMFEALQLAPTRTRLPQDEDDWKWTLRSVSNRPILRVLQDDLGPVMVSSSEGKAKALRAHVAFITNGQTDDASPSGVDTAFKVERSLFGSDVVSFNGNVDPSGTRASLLRASYAHQFSDGTRPQVSFTMRRFAAPASVRRDAALSALSVRAVNSTSLLGFIDLNYGSELQTVQFEGRANALRPFGSVTVHTSPDMYVEYRYTSVRPEADFDRDFAAAAADLSGSGPRFSMLEGSPLLEQAAHHEIALSRRLGKQGQNRFQAAFYADSIRHLTPSGVGTLTEMRDGPVPDVYANTFSYDAGNFSTQGFRLVGERDLAHKLTAALTYSYGGATALANMGQVQHVGALDLFTAQRHAVAAKVYGTVPKAGTKWAASYKWTSGKALTDVDQFNAGAGQADPYFDVFLRQPIPASKWLPTQMEALVDVRNLLAQGYVPVIGQDGQTLYLVQAPRSIRGGLAFSF